jgi:hypothetical protein
MKKALITLDSSNMAFCKANSFSKASNMLACFASKDSFREKKNND